jgi:hypothetical protein
MLADLARAPVRLLAFTPLRWLYTGVTRAAKRLTVVV